ncbi:MAG: M23 family peptidase [Nitratiruptor sp.]|nr:M23 family peptidase [Nitratiruptor sp.]NPA83406.1 M23 family metallopeptidase [Campylobacterota bacterium]
MRWWWLLLVPVLLGAASIANGQTYMVPFRKGLEAPIPYTTIGNIALFPIPYRSKGRRILLRVDGQHQFLSIRPKAYPKERLRVDPKKVTPPKSLGKRIQAEYREAMELYKRKGARNYIHRPFILPLTTTITSPFGTARLFNGKLSSYHSGVDFRAPVGTPVRAINDGRVVLVKNRYFAGNSVIIDHGGGVYSCYYHLSRFKVKPGELVKRGEVIALSGKSGRVTGPHLHLGIRVLGVSVDPIDFIQRFNALYTPPKP